MHRLYPLISVLLFATAPLAYAETPRSPFASDWPVGLCAFPANDQGDQPALDEAPVNVTADSAHTSSDTATFEGNVNFQQGARQLTAERIEMDRNAGTVSASGGIHYRDPTLTVDAESLEAQANSNTASLNQAQYHLNGRQGRGSAGSLAVDETNSLVLSEATFTTCPPGDESWRIRAEEIELNGETEIGVTRGTWLYIGNVPVFYVPYFSFPLGNKRKSGFLYPYVSTKAKYGLELATPYYVDIAPQLDLTFTPRLMTERGVQLQNELRYLTEHQKGELNFEYMDKDRGISSNDSRYLINWEHAINYQQHWRGYVTFTEVSDSNYLNDLGSKVASSTNNRIERRADLGYYDSHWWLAATMTDYQILGDAFEPYRTSPSVDFYYSTPDVSYGIDFSVTSELTRFEHSNNSIDTATRWHIEPSLVLPFQGPSGGLSVETKLYHTMYRQDLADSDSTLDESVTRTLPYLRAYGNLVLERDALMFDNAYTQTLEPQFQYLYVPYQDQSNIGLYDTGSLAYDYNSLFRDRRFVGYDRIADANQITLGLSTRFLDQGSRETFKYSLGQIFYLSDSRVTSAGNSGLDEGRSALASELDFSVGTDWYFHNRMQYDVDRGRLNKAEFLVDYRPDNQRRLQFSVRNVPDITTDQTIEQAGLVGAWPLSDSLQFVGSFYHDLERRRILEGYAGLQYETCCYALRFGYHRHLNTNFIDPSDPLSATRKEYDAGFFLRIVVKGLGPSGGLDYEEMLRASLFGNLNRYYLNN